MAKSIEVRFSTEVDLGCRTCPIGARLTIQGYRVGMHAVKCLTEGPDLPYNVTEAVQVSVGKRDYPPSPSAIHHQLGDCAAHCTYVEAIGAAQDSLTEVLDNTMGVPIQIEPLSNI